MSAEADDAPPTFRWWDVIRGVEPPPAAFLARQPFHPWLVVAVTCIGAFIGQLDASIVQLALPALKSAFDVSVNEVRWVAVAYLLAYAASLPIFGRVCEMYGRKLLYLIGFTLFTVASLLCGFAPDLVWLVAFRILQGIGGAMLGANGLSILVKSVDPQRRARAIGVNTAAQAVGISAGPVVGGLLLQALDWQWVFWATVPFGVAGVFFGWLVLPRTADLVGDKTFDWYGALLLMPSLVLAILALNQVSVWPLVSPEMILCTVAAVVFMVLFVRQERAAARPLVDLILFRNKAFTAGVIGILLAYALLFGMFFFVSFALIHGLHDSVRVTGFKMAVIPIAIGLVAPLGIFLSESLGSRAVRATGMALCVAALVVLSAIVLHSSGSLISGLSAFALFGVGLGLFMAPNNDATLSAAPASHAGTASAMLSLLRVLGSCIGISSASSVMSWRMEAMAGSAGQDVFLAGHPLLEAVESSLGMLVVFAVVAGCASLVRPRGPA
jgi:EmrB/QacA subfamily drug resistance transporter